MKQQLDVENWNRKEHFLFFKQFEEPFLVQQSQSIAPKPTIQRNTDLVFIYYLHKTLETVNHIDVLNTALQKITYMFTTN
jgi:chloramphenicol O-acetyltransferase type A